jgi:hypothetical protein
MPPVRAIRRRGRTLGAAAALALAACLASGCGDDSSAGLSQQRGSSLRSSLDRVQARVASGDCTGAAQQAAEFHTQVESLPSRVDSKLRDALVSSAARLESLVSEQCKEASTTVEEPPAQEPTTTDESAGDQQGKGKKDKKPKKQKEEPPADTGGTGDGTTGATGATGPEGTTLPPGGG